MALTKMRTGTLGLGRGDLRARDAGTWGREDAGTWGHGDVGTRKRGDAGTWGRGDSAARIRGDVGTFPFWCKNFVFGLFIHK